MNFLWLVLVVAVADASVRWWPAATSEGHGGMPEGHMIVTVLVITFLAAHAAVCFSSKHEALMLIQLEMEVTILGIYIYIYASSCAK